jgi:hypothetical protein
MAFDSVPGGDPRGPWCPKCARPIEAGEPTTMMHTSDEAQRHVSRPWHAECARPYWDKVTPLLDQLRRGFGG